MSKKTAAATEQQESLKVAAADAPDQAEPDAAEKAEAERPAAEKADAESAGVLLRRECIQGVWYPHGALLTCSAQLARALEQDGALDLHPAAVEHALANGAQQLIHHAPELAAD